MRKHLFNVLVLVLVTTIASGLLASNVNTKIANASNDFQTTLKKEHSLNEWIIKLQHQESGENEDIVILDSNNKFSYGCLQFQFDTFKKYVRRYGLFPYTEDDELLNFIMDCDIQKDLAKLMIKDDINNWQHWYNSVVGYRGIKGIGKPQL